MVNPVRSEIHRLVLNFASHLHLLLRLRNELLGLLLNVVDLRRLEYFLSASLFAVGHKAHPRSKARRVLHSLTVDLHVRIAKWLTHVIRLGAFALHVTHFDVECIVRHLHLGRIVVK